VKAYVDAINAYLLESHARGHNNVLVIDEAQNLSAQVLEQLRLLTNLETSERKLLQIILIGQPELRTMLARPELEQLAQRVIARYHLGPLSAAETGAYVAHRLAVAGVQGAAPVPSALAPLIHRLTDGVPRRINLLCDRAMLGAYVENSREATPKILRRAAREVFAGEGQGTAPRTPMRWPFVAGGVLAGAAISAAAWQAVPRHPAPVPVKMQAAAPAKAAGAAAQPLALSTQDDALRELGVLWGQQLPASAPCDGAPRLGLRCYQGHGGLYELRLLDRPAIIALHDGAKVGYAVLTGMDDDSATLTIDGRRHTVNLGLLATRVDGDYTTMWKVPRGFRDQVGPGDSGPDVDWIAARLAELDGKRAAPPSGQVLDEPLLRLLRAFQVKQNLKADGLAGPRTYMRLNQLSGVDEPRLLAATGK
jgi:general secretion pathway protein A